MNYTAERILIVDNNPEIVDVIARQALQPLGYQVEIVHSAAMAIQQVAHFFPDVIITNLTLPGLSGKDLLVALSSQGLDTPVIVISEKGKEGEVIQAFRLGATDYLYWPTREAEIVSSVERVLKQVRTHREREDLVQQLYQTNQDLQKRVRELTTIFAIGKAITSISDQTSLHEKIVEGGIYIAEADCGWLLLKSDQRKEFILSAARHLPKSITDRLHHPWDDGISALVSISGETLTIHGDPLKRFKISQFGKAALVTPLKANKVVIGLLVVVRKTAKPFNKSTQELMEAVADYASISLINSRYFRVLEERARSLQIAVETAQSNEHQKEEQLANFNYQILPLLNEAMEMAAALLIEGKKLDDAQRSQLHTLQDKLQKISGKLLND
ncbi:MAG: response regulator [Anaerolineales bacterium]|nr:response regulator [Anaerolineales bacterium]